MFPSAVYHPASDLYFDLDAIPSKLRDLLLFLPGVILNPPIREGGYRPASAGVIRRMMQVFG